MSSLCRPDKVHIGRVVPCSADLKLALSCCAKDGFDFITAHVSQPRCCLTLQEVLQDLPPCKLPDSTFTSSEWGRLIVSSFSSWIDPDSSDSAAMLLSEKALIEELDYFAYLGLPAVIVPLKGKSHFNLARLLATHLNGHPYYQAWVRVPLCAASNTALVPDTLGPDGEADAAVAIEEDSWERWQRFRSACDNNVRLGVALEITADLPNSPNDLRRWMGEQVKSIVLSTSIFTSNEKGFPTLTKAHQEVVSAFFQLGVQVILDGTYESSESGSDTDVCRCKHVQYLDYLWKKLPKKENTAEWAVGYEDYLQTPLQPLGDNLESQVYETFELDPTKYREYHRALTLAMCDKQSKLASADADIVVMVLGAGRGPLVTACLDCADSLNCKIKLYAIEKNPYAVITLKSLNESKWDHRVNIICTDMRNFHPEVKADIVVSELLGSFGDNELSPECLDGALHLFKEDGISIPCSYTSYVAPIQSLKLFNEVRTAAEREKNALVAYESPYVVMMSNYFEVAKPLPLFTFSHPNFNKTPNTRYKEVHFTAPVCCQVTGFVGYFTACLYPGVELSTVPDFHTPELFSWFSILFPLMQPMCVSKGEDIAVQFWRCCSRTKVWYEWCVANPAISPIMNVSGRSYAIRSA